jgi:hypothetical protein
MEDSDHTDPCIRNWEFDIQLSIEMIQRQWSIHKGLQPDISCLVHNCSEALSLAMLPAGTRWELRHLGAKVFRFLNR